MLVHQRVNQHYESSCVMEPPGGFQDMSSEVAKIAGDAVEAAAQVQCGAVVALMAINGDFTVISWTFHAF